DGPLFTVRATAVLVDEPQELVATQSYEAASPVATGLMVSVAEVAPGMLTVFFRHWRLGAGVPAAATVNEAEGPGPAGGGAGGGGGGGETEGRVLRVGVAELLPVEPQRLVTTQSYEPASPAPTGLIVKVVEVAPAMLDPFFRHWNVGDGEADAATVKDADVPG